MIQQILTDIISFFRLDGIIEWTISYPGDLSVFDFLASFFAPVAIVSIPLILLLIIRRIFHA